MSLAQLQQQMQGIYELNIAHDVNDYLVTCSQLAGQLNPANLFPNAREKLLFQEDDNNLDVSLYLDHTVISNLEKNNPVENLHEKNLEDFCLALEGISHFLYLIWNASHDKSVTLLELELQAEIDKFIMLFECMEQQGKAIDLEGLRNLLFESVSFEHSLGFAERERYRDANYFAGKYCWHLQTKYLGKGKQALLNELRRFYRFNQEDKLRWINAS